MQPNLAVAQGTISTVAGGSGFLDNIPAIQARLDGPGALAVDSQGDAYISDGPRIRRIDAKTGIISTVAANLSSPANFAWDVGGNLIFTGFQGEGLFRLVLATGAVTLIAGSQTSSTPQFGFMAGVATDQAGNIFVTDDYHNKIYRIDANAQAVTTIAGTGLAGPPAGSGDGGPATQATLLRPGAIVLDSLGNIYEDEQYSVRRIDARTGIITTVMPVNSNSTGDGGPYTKATLNNPTALATDAQGNLYIADGPRIRKIDWKTGIISTIAGSGKTQYTMDGAPVLQANLSYMTQLSVDAEGDLWLADSGNRRLFLILASTDAVQTIAGTSANGDGGPALGALLTYPIGLASDAQGDLFIAEAGGAIRRVDHTTGFISTIARLEGLNSQGGQIAVDSNGNLLCPTGDRISRVDAISGAVTTVAGGNGSGFSGDGGPAIAAAIGPSAVAVDSLGNLFIADDANHRIRRVDATTGIITTIAGNGGSLNGAYNGAVGPATEISIGFPTAIAVSQSGQVFWNTFLTNAGGQVLTVDSSGMLSIAAGNGGCYYAGDGGLANLASLCQLRSLSFDAQGNLFAGEVADVRRIDGTTGLIQTVAGTGVMGQSADDIPSTQAQLTVSAMTTSGPNLYVLDNAISAYPRVRLVAPAMAPPLPQPPTITQIVDAVDGNSTYSPGELVSVMGNYLGQPSPAPAQVGPDGKVASSLGGDQVMFNGIGGPLLYVSAAQINTVVPYEVPIGKVTVTVQTAAGAVQASINVSAASLALYPQVFNPDGSVNSSTNLATKGATLVVYGTGMGQTNPAGVDGEIVQGPNLAQPVHPISATVTNGNFALPAQVAYAGPLPGAIAGAMQVNVVIPASAQPGESTLTLSSQGSYSKALPIYMLSDPPVLTGVTPAPVQQTVGSENTITLTGANLNKIVSAAFSQNGSPANLQQSVPNCAASTSCSVSLNFSGQSGSFGVTVTNAAGQTSNQITFAVQPPPPPTITSVGIIDGQIRAIIGNQPLFVVGNNFETPISVKVYLNGSVVQTLSSSVFPQITDVIPTSFYMDFNSQAIAGQYEIVVSGPNGSSAPFSFTVLAP